MTYFTDLSEGFPLANKWLSTEPEDCVAAVAERALRDRFLVVCRYLPLAADEEENREHVHQLRVATRRAVAALEIFQPLLPRRRAGKMKKELRRIRRTLGPARDLDVLAERLETLVRRGENGAVAKVLDKIARQRRRAQKPVRKIFHRAGRIKLKRQMKRLARRARHPDQCQFGPFARQGMRVVVDDFFQAAEADLNDIENLHSLRIAGKQLRYAMEVYAGAFGPVVRKDLSPIFAEVQERLGAINDHATAQRLFHQWELGVTSKQAAKRMRQMADFEERQLGFARQAFLEWWTEQRAGELYDRFEALLADPARAPDKPVFRASTTVKPALNAPLTSGSSGFVR